MPRLTLKQTKIPAQIQALRQQADGFNTLVSELERFVTEHTDTDFHTTEGVALLRMLEEKIEAHPCNVVTAAGLSVFQLSPLRQSIQNDLQQEAIAAARERIRREKEEAERAAIEAEERAEVERLRNLMQKYPEPQAAA